MKKLCILLLFVFSLPTFVWANSPRFGKTKTRQARPVSEQIDALLTYPEIFKKGNQGGIVVIQFRVDEENRVAKLQVHSGNAALNADLIRQLTGRKLYLTESTPFDTHTVRLHFQSATPK